MKRLTVTADDFGLSAEVNEAVEIAHRTGILSAASLMVAGRAATDAVRRARAMPSLRVGLHLTLVEDEPMLPRSAIPHLVRRDGLLRTDMTALSLTLAARPAARRELQAEIAAQFEAFRATGLPLDHVNAHKHFHINPLVAPHVLAIGRTYGMRRLRAPREPLALIRAIEPRSAPARLTGHLARRLASRAEAAGFSVDDRVFGLAWSGAMTEARIAALIRALPQGRSEIYTHPATSSGFRGAAPLYRYEEELTALTASAVRDAVRRGGIVLDRIQ